MRTKAHRPGKKRPGPEPQKISLHSLDFDEAADILVGKKPKKKPGEMVSEEEKRQSTNKD